MCIRDRYNTINWRDTTHFDSEDDYCTGRRNVSHVLSTTTVLFSTTFTRTIIINLLMKWPRGSNLSQFYKLLDGTSWFLYCQICLHVLSLNLPFLLKFCFSSLWALPRLLSIFSCLLNIVTWSLKIEIIILLFNFDSIQEYTPLDSSPNCGQTANFAKGRQHMV